MHIVSHATQSLSAEFVCTEALISAYTFGLCTQDKIRSCPELHIHINSYAYTM